MRTREQVSPESFVHNNGQAKMNAQVFEKVSPLEFYRRFSAQTCRPDGRAFRERRPLMVTDGAIGTAEGSCSVRIGNTVVLAGVKAEVGPPRVESPDRGRVTITVELPALCAARHRVPVHQNVDAQVITALVNEWVSSRLDTTSLLIGDGDAVWLLYVDVYCLEDDGNVLDAALIAASSVLSQLQLPHIDVTEESEAVADPSRMHPAFPAGAVPTLVPLSFAVLPVDQGKHGLIAVIDPTQRECDLASLHGALLTVVTDGEFNVVHVHKMGGSPIPFPLLDECIREAVQAAPKTLAAVRAHVQSNQSALHRQ
jgi:exosome complex component RRP43